MRLCLTRWGEKPGATSPMANLLRGGWRFISPHPLRQNPTLTFFLSPACRHSPSISLGSGQPTRSLMNYSSKTWLDILKFDIASQKHIIKVMANQSSTEILERINDLERDLQKLKLETFFSLPQKRQTSLYPEAELRKAIEKTRKSIWQKRYAQKM
jgi:hypothetical protein